MQKMKNNDSCISTSRRISAQSFSLNANANTSSVIKFLDAMTIKQGSLHIRDFSASMTDKQQPKITSDLMRW